MAGSCPIVTWSRVIDDCPFPKMTDAGGPSAEGKLFASTVDRRRMLASAPMSNRAVSAELAALHAKLGAASQAVESRLSPVTPRRVSSSAIVADQMTAGSSCRQAALRMGFRSSRLCLGGMPRERG